MTRGEGSWVCPYWGRRAPPVYSTVYPEQEVVFVDSAGCLKVCKARLIGRFSHHVSASPFFFMSVPLGGYLYNFNHKNANLN